MAITRSAPCSDERRRQAVRAAGSRRRSSTARPAAAACPPARSDVRRARRCSTATGCRPRLRARRQLASRAPTGAARGTGRSRSAAAISLRAADLEDRHLRGAASLRDPPTRVEDRLHLGLDVQRSVLAFGSPPGRRPRRGSSAGRAAALSLSDRSRARGGAAGRRARWPAGAGRAGAAARTAAPSSGSVGLDDDVDDRPERASGPTARSTCASVPSSNRAAQQRAARIGQPRPRPSVSERLRQTSPRPDGSGASCSPSAVPASVVRHRTRPFSNATSRTSSCASDGGGSSGGSSAARGGRSARGADRRLDLPRLPGQHAQQLLDARRGQLVHADSSSPPPDRGTRGSRRRTRPAGARAGTCCSAGLAGRGRARRGSASPRTARRGPSSARRRPRLARSTRPTRSRSTNAAARTSRSIQTGQSWRCSAAGRSSRASMPWLRSRTHSSRTAASCSADSCA